MLPVLVVKLAWLVSLLLSPIHLDFNMLSECQGLQAFLPRYQSKMLRLSPDSENKCFLSPFSFRLLRCLTFRPWITQYTFSELHFYYLQFSLHPSSIHFYARGSTSQSGSALFSFVSNEICLFLSTLFSF